jgi:hypothetical protein
MAVFIFFKNVLKGHIRRRVKDTGLLQKIAIFEKKLKRFETENKQK